MFTIFAERVHHFNYTSGSSYSYEGFAKVFGLKQDILVVGSGVGGATVARELAIRGLKVTILEKGKHYKLGNRTTAGAFYSSKKSIDRTEIFRTVMVGGSSMVTLANGIRALQKELKALGIDLETEFKEAEKELGVAPLPERLMGERSKKLLKASKELGYDPKPMPKFIDFSKCRSCGMCVLGCRYSAKWTAQNFLREAHRAGVRLLTQTTVNEVLHSNGEVKGVRIKGPSGVSEIEAENVVLSAGGIGTPIILLRSGMDEAGSNLFADLFVNTYGLVAEGCMQDEIGMATIIDKFHEKYGFVLSPFLEQPVGKAPIADKFYKKVGSVLPTFLEQPLVMFHRLNSPRRLPTLMRRKTLGLMTKISDDGAGKVDIYGNLHKPITKNDRRKLSRGYELARKILTQAGASPRSFYTTGIGGSSPGGTAAIGHIVNIDHETEISRLFVSDASLFPKAPGAPLVLTIVALSKRFSKKLASEYL